MSQRFKNFILAFVFFLALGVFLQAQFDYLSLGKKEFQVTPNPSVEYQKAVEEGKPVFLEFYARW